MMVSMLLKSWARPQAEHWPIRVYLLDLDQRRLQFTAQAGLLLEFGRLKHELEFHS